MYDRNILLETSQGNIELKLMPEVAPRACENFTRLIEKGYYNGVIFHRVIKNLLIQGGDPEGTGRGGQSIWGGKFENECTPDVLFDREGLLAMANNGPNSNGSQFFITTAATPRLDGKHTVFGEVVAGYDVVKQIEEMKTDPISHRPLEFPKILKATVMS
jgi:peptidylprolyl isomerase